MIIKKNNWWVPETDKMCLPVTLRESRHIETLIKPYLKNFRCCVQAGGNVGVWPVKYSEFFEKVYTFEPDKANYQALVKNTENIKNIYSANAAISSKVGRTRVIHFRPENAGAHYIDPNAMDGDVEMVTIDSLGLFNVDLVQLDIEGAEHDGLVGATNTIKEWSPVIVVELTGRGARFKHSNIDTIQLLLDTFNYRLVKATSKDWIFIK